jgi:hypothetical protein
MVFPAQEFLPRSQELRLPCRLGIDVSIWGDAGRRNLRVYLAGCALMGRDFAVISLDYLFLFGHEPIRIYEDRQKSDAIDVP